MKINGNEIRPGNVIRHKDVIWIAIKISHVKPGKGGAFAQVELKKASDGTKLNERFRSSETVERLRLESKRYQFLFLEGKTAHFMDNETFEHIQLSTDILEERLSFLQEGIELEIESFDILKKIPKFDVLKNFEFIKGIFDWFISLEFFSLF